MYKEFHSTLFKPGKKIYFNSADSKQYTNENTSHPGLFWMEV